jgi:hypothetical protein
MQLWYEIGCRRNLNLFQKKRCSGRTFEALNTWIIYPEELKNRRYKFTVKDNQLISHILDNLKSDDRLQIVLLEKGIAKNVNPLD